VVPRLEVQLEPLHQFFFVMGIFEISVLWTVCPGWLSTVILLISASWVARIADESHWHPAENPDSYILHGCIQAGRHNEGDDKSLLKVREKIAKSHEGPGVRWKQREDFQLQKC
jgi:hypothetical protein